MLVVIAVIGIIVAIAVPTMGSITDKADIAKSQRNAQNVCSLHAAALSVGVLFSSTDKGGILDEIISGKTSSAIAGSKFQMSSLSVDEKVATLEYCSFDSVTGQMIYNPNGGEESTSEPPWESVGMWHNNSLANQLNIFNQIWPEYDLRTEPAVDQPDHSFILRRLKM